MEYRNEGVCRFCLKTFSGRSIGRHLSTCQAKQQEDSRSSENKPARRQIYHIKIRGYDPFWLHIEMDTNSTLSDLDSFLRNIWLECCGHLSEFTVDGVRYSGEGKDDDDWGIASKSMRIKVGKVLDIKDKLEYVYDFGSSTYLQGQVLHARQGVLNEKVRILARNNLPPYLCGRCQSKATELCSECEDFYCEDCVADHGCEDDFYLTVANSPRMGVCAYDGEYDFDKFGSRSEAKSE